MNTRKEILRGCGFVDMLTIVYLSKLVMVSYSAPFLLADGPGI